MCIVNIVSIIQMIYFMMKLIEFINDAIGNIKDVS